MAQTDFNPDHDCTVDEQAPDTNQDEIGLWVRVVVGEKTTVVMRSFLGWGLAALAGATIDSASLFVYCYAVGPAETAMANVNRTLSFGETTITWNNQPAAQGAPLLVGYSIAEATGWLEITGLKGMVQDAIDNRSNELWLRIALALEVGDSKTNAYSDAEAVTENYPYLRVVYTPAVGAARRIFIC